VSMKKNRKKYDVAFKLEAIRLVVEEGRKVSEVERNLDISKGTSARWVREQKADSEMEKNHLHQADGENRFTST